MAGQFIGSDGDLETAYVTDYGMIDQFALNSSLWTSGLNGSGQLGDNTNVSKSSPVQTVSGGTNWVFISAGTGHSGGIKSDGTLWLCGANSQGSLGDNSSTVKSSPVQTVAGGINWKQIVCSNVFSAAIKTDGTLWTWGYNASGQLGISNTTSQSSPVQTVAGGTNWKQVACNNGNTAAIKVDGTLWICGGNSNGQLGDNTVTPKSSPVQTVAGGNNWKQVAASGNDIAAIKTDGTLWTWGSSLYGQLGDSTTTNKSSPVQTVSGGTNWELVACGNYHMAAIKTDGTLWTWGRDNYGQLGNNAIVDQSSPIQTVAGGTNWKQVACSQYSCAAVKTDGTLWTWGYNTQGQLGDNSSAHKSSPVQTIAGGNNWKQVSIGGNLSAIYFYDANNLYPNS